VHVHAEVRRNQADDFVRHAVALHVEIISWDIFLISWLIGNCPVVVLPPTNFRFTEI
jgi:hypothetical protein